MPAGKTILCFGDSNTHGTMPMTSMTDRSRYAWPVRWPGILATELGEGFHIVEEGHPGRTTVHPDPLEGIHKNGLAVLPALLESHRPLDLVVVLLGTNDLKARFSLTPFDIAYGVGRIVDTTRNSESGPTGAAPSVLLVSPPPIIEVGILAEMFAGGEAKSHRLAAAYCELAADRGIAYLDASRHIQSSSADGIHLSAEAHVRLGRAVAGAVRPLLTRQ